MHVAHSTEPFAASLLAAAPTSASDRDVADWLLADEQDVADARLKLVLAGYQRAAASLLWALEARADRPPRPGDLRLVRDGHKRPGAVIEVVESRIVPFDQVDEHFAVDVGEGDLSLEHWRTMHWRAFERQCRELGRLPSNAMPVVCVRFQVVFLPPIAG